MEDKECVPELAIQYYSSYNNAGNYEIMSPEYVNEIVEEVLDDENHTKNSFTKSSRSSSEIVNVVEVNDEVYVAVGKDDLDVVRWAIDHVVSPGARLYLVHVFPPITHIPTPVGKLSRSQLTEEQVRFYIKEEENRRRNILQKYIRLCKDAKVNVDTVLVEHDATAKAIVDLIAIHRITNLVIGLKKLPNSRILKTRMAKGEYVKKSAPEFCEVTIVHDGKKVSECQKVVRFVHPPQALSPKRSSGVTRHSERNLFLCACFSVGKLSRSQLTEEQVRFYIKEEENRRRNILQNYIRLCKDAKVNVDTVLVEHDATAKAIVDLIAIHRITNLVMGLKKLPNSRILKTRMAKGEYVKKSAPEFCEVTIVHDGKKVSECQKVVRFVHPPQASSPKRSSGVTRHSERNLFLCACFSARMR